MTRAPLRVAALAAALLAAGCTGQTKAPDTGPVRNAAGELQDALIAADVRAALVSHEPTDGAGIQVAVRGGVVTLRGLVKDGTTRRRLVELAQETPHVTRVVDFVGIDRRRQRLEDRVGDAALAARVQAAVSAEVGFQVLAVRVEGGTAILDGRVPDAKTKAAAARAAGDTAGIRNVVDRIRVGGP
ncbi:MAG TPA: BON domain-containing protein [Candidatus Elarobacter sp.]